MQYHIKIIILVLISIGVIISCRKQIQSSSNKTNSDADEYATGMPETFNGTYISEQLISRILKTRSYVYSMQQIELQNIYSVLSIDNAVVSSDLNLHDRYDLKSIIFANGWGKNDSSKVIDNNKNVYVKISNDIDYFTALSKLYFKTLLKRSKYNDSKGNNFELLENGNVKINGTELSLLLDVLSRKSKMDVIYSNEPEIAYGIIINDRNIRIFDVKLTGDFEDDVDDNNIELKYEFFQ